MKRMPCWMATASSSAQRSRPTSLDPDAVVARESQGYGGVRCLVRRSAVPATLTLERPTVEDIILFLVKGVKSV